MDEVIAALAECGDLREVLKIAARSPILSSQLSGMKPGTKPFSPGEPRVGMALVEFEYEGARLLLLKPYNFLEN